MKFGKLSIVGLLAVLVLVLAACSGRAGSTQDEAVATDSGNAVESPVSTEADSVQEENATDGDDAEDDGMAGSAWAAWVANGMDDSLSVVEVASGTEIARLPAGINPHILAASPAGDIIYVINAGSHDRGPDAHGGGDMDAMAAGDTDDAPSDGHGADEVTDSNSLWAIEAASGNVLARIPVGMGPTHPIASLDGERVYVTNTDEGSVTVIDTGSWDVLATIANLPEPHDGELTPDGMLLYLATAGDSTMSVVDTSSLEIVKTFEIGDKPRGLAVGGGNGEIAYVTNKADGTMSIIDVPEDEVVATELIGKGAHAVRVSPDGQTVYVALSGEDAVAVYDVGQRDVKTLIPVGAVPEQLDLSSDGRWLLVSNNGDNTLSIVDLDRGMTVNTVPVGQGAYGVQATEVNMDAKPVTASPVLDLPLNADGYRDISVEQLAEMMDDKNFALVNVHIPDQGDLPNTDLSIPFNEVGARTDELPSKDSPIVLYCRSGSMSTQAANVLAGMGYTNILEVDGGFNAWQAAGHELLNAQ